MSETPQPDAADQQASILIVSPFPEDREFLASLFEPLHWKVIPCRCYREAITALALDRVKVIVCECELSDGNWRDLLGQTEALPDPPCLIVASRIPDDYLWAEVLNLGGYDLLAKPFEREEVLRVAELAYGHSQRETERRAAAPGRRLPDADKGNSQETPARTRALYGW